MLVQDEGTIPPFLCNARPQSYVRLFDHKPIVPFKMQLSECSLSEVSVLCIPAVTLVAQGLVDLAR